MSKAPEDCLIEYCEPVKVVANSEKMSASSPKFKPTLNPVEKKLADILPPREWAEANGQKYIQQVSSVPASRNVILSKETLLDKRLEDAQARESGICPARREIYSELMDELIRQIAITTPETGTLLVQVRDEINMSLSGYETIFASANAFGSLNALKAELGKEEKRDEVNGLQANVDKNKKEISELKAQLESVSRREQEEKDALVRRQQEQLTFLKRNNQQLKSQVDSIMSSRK